MSTYRKGASTTQPSGIGRDVELTFICSRCGRHHASAGYLYTCVQCGPAAILEANLPGLDAGLAFTDSPGIWRYERLLPIAASSPRPPLIVGNTPLLPGGRLSEALGLPNLFLKNDALNPTGSLKDRASAVVLTRAAEIGADRVAVASTGNAGSSLAGLAASMGIAASIFVPESAPRAKLVQSLMYGAQVFAVRGTYDDAFDLCAQACERFGWYNRSTAVNPYTIEGKKTVALEIYEQLGNRAPDLVLVPSGDGCVLSGVARGFRDLRDLGLISAIPRLIAVQATGSDAIARALETDGRIRQMDARTVADSISVGLPRNGWMAARDVRDSRGRAVRVTDEEILEAMYLMASLTGIFAEPAAAASLAGLKALLSDRDEDREMLIVLLVTGTGLKDVAVAGTAAPQPHTIDARMESLEEALRLVT